MALGEREHNLDIAIIGGGIAGLVCAVGLAKKGIYVNVYESKVSD